MVRVVVDRYGACVMQRLRDRIVMVLLREEVRGQGRHVDPEDPGTAQPSTKSTAALGSANMAVFADVLRPPAGGPVREGVVGDLAEFHGLDPDEVVKRCLNWEDESVEEWRAAPRDTPAGITDFYNTIESWSFDLLWYAYLQTEGYAYPETVVVADRLGPPSAGARMLDLGSGAGVTAQFFAALGYEVTLADISVPLLTFARWRLERRGVPATYVPLPADLPEGHYDLVTALDVIAHVPDPAETAARLHRALRSGGLFVANFDVRRHSPQNAWHLYEDDLPLRWAVERAGFVPVRLIDGVLWVYRARSTTGANWLLRKAFAWVRLASPPARAIRAARRSLARAALVLLARRGRP
jgi:SAM-dependent methyltransferase